MRERARTEIPIENFSRSRFEEKKRVGSAVQGNFFRVGRVRRTTEFFFWPYVNIFRNLDQPLPYNDSFSKLRPDTPS